MESTRVVGRAISEASRPPRVWLQASTATIYSHRYDAPNDEKSGLIGGVEPDAPASWKFSTDVASAWLSSSKWMLEIGAALMRSETELILKSRRVVPGRLLRSGFSFGFPTWPEAAADLCRRWREPRP